MSKTMQQWPINSGSDKPGNVYLVVLPEVHLLDFAGPAQVLAHERLVEAPAVHYVSSRPNVIAAQGLALTDLQPLPNSVAPKSWVVLIGFAKAHELINSRPAKETVAWLKRQDWQNITLCSVCSGALLLAKAGLLADKKCTTHHALLDLLKRISPSAKVQEDRLFVNDQNIWSSAGISTGIDLCLHMVSITWGHRIANEIARDLLLYHRRDGHESQNSVWLQFRNHLNHRVHKVQDLIAQRPDCKWNIEQLASEVHVSPRHLARLFHDETGLSIGDYQQQLRLSLAEQWLQFSEYTIEQIAEKSGFGSTRQFRRIWAKWRPGVPSEGRRN